MKILIGVKSEIGSEMIQERRFLLELFEVCNYFYMKEKSS